VTPQRSEGTTPADVFYEAAARFLDAQISTGDVLDNKNANAFSVGSTVLPLTFGFLSLGSTNVPTIAEIALGLALFFYLLLLIFAFRASLIRALEYRPDIPTLHKHSGSFVGDDLRGWVAREYMASTEGNQPILERKARWVGAATVALYLESLALSVAALLTLLL
jgi:hypothetical protein